MNTILSRSLLTGLVIFLALPWSYGGTIDDHLQQKLNTVSPTEFVPLIIMLDEQADIRSITAMLDAENATRQRRNETVVRALQSVAERTQPPLLSFLAHAEADGEVRSITAFWITNMIVAEVRASYIPSLALRGDIGTIYLFPAVELPTPVASTGPPFDALETVSDGIVALNVPSVWQLGITGKGIIVLTNDTGVDGNHPYIGPRWRGHLPGVPVNAAWNDIIAATTFPQDLGDHGSAATSCMTGSSGTDTIGISNDAVWIANRAWTGSGLSTTALINGFQWAVDPDGNPGTVDDVPHVMNNSWGAINAGCFSSYWNLIDNTEAAGVTVVFSAGNTGPTASSVRSPANRTMTATNAFAVGALNANSETIASFSGRGPSPCVAADSLIIKPEVCARGVAVKVARAMAAGGGTSFYDGTSFSAPYVSGVLALLSQVNPHATPDQLKRALLATAVDLGPAGEDNDYGHGRVDALEACKLISPYTVTGIVRESGTNAPVANVRIIVNGMTLARSGSNGAYSVKMLRDTVNVTFSHFQYADTSVTLVLTPNLPLTFNIHLQSNPIASFSGSVLDSATGQGIVANVYLTEANDPSGGPTYSVVTQANGSYSVNAALGTYTVRVQGPLPYPDAIIRSSVAHGAGGTVLNISATPAHIFLIDDDNGEDYERYFHDVFDSTGISRRTWDRSALGLPTISDIALFSEPRILYWFTGSDTTNALTASERSLLINHLDAGGRLLLTGQNIAEFSTGGDLLLSNYLGVAFSTNATGFAANTVRGYPGDEVGNGLVISLLGGAANQNSKDQLALTGTHLGNVRKVLYYGTDTTRIAAVRSEEIGRGYKAVFLGFGAEGIGSLPSRTILFERAYNYLVDPTFIVSVDEGRWAGEIPREFIVEQNYPNPFNPSTTVRIGIPEQATVTVRIFNALGQEVNRLFDGEIEPGHHEVLWNGRSSIGTNVSSGLYFLRVEAAGASGALYTRTRKMLMLK